MVKDMEVLADVVEAAVRADRYPLVLGGDNSVSIGTMAGLARVEPRQGLIWVDAHADFNIPETTPSGNIHGMPVAAIVGDGDPRLAEVGGVTPKALEQNLVWIALREVDPRERDRVKASPATAFTMRDIDEMGMRRVTAEAIRLATQGGVDQVHLCFDMDSIDPRYAPGTGTPGARGALLPGGPLDDGGAQRCRDHHLGGVPRGQPGARYAQRHGGVGRGADLLAVGEANPLISGRWL